MPVNIGIVDDIASNRNILKNKLLRDSHFEVTLTAENGNDFLEKMQEVAADANRISTGGPITVLIGNTQ